MRGLGPRIHQTEREPCEGMDCRDEPGNDEGKGFPRSGVCHQTGGELAIDLDQ